MILQEGGSFCLSDDAHNTSQIGLNYARLREWANSVGVTGKMIKRLKRREGDGAGGGGGVEAVPCEDVWEDSFWDNTRAV
jgi:histidinol-phosphatase (PHP family)